MNDHVGRRDQLERPRRHQPGVTRARAHQIYGHGASTRSDSRRSSRAPAASMRSAQRRPPAPAAPHGVAQPRRAVGEPDPAGQLHFAGPSSRAWAPTGVLQDAPEAVHERPLGAHARHRRGVADRASAAASSAPARACRASAPCPAAGTTSLAAPRRRRPRARAAAAGQRQHERVDLAVGELAQPGVDVAAQLHDLDSLRSARSWAARRTLLVPIRAPGASSAIQRRRRSRRARSARSGIATSSRPSASSAGRPWPSARPRRCGLRAAPARARTPSATCPRRRRRGPPGS